MGLLFSVGFSVGVQWLVCWDSAEYEIIESHHKTKLNHKNNTADILLLCWVWNNGIFGTGLQSQSWKSCFMKFVLERNLIWTFSSELCDFIIRKESKKKKNQFEMTIKYTGYAAQHRLYCRAAPLLSTWFFLFIYFCIINFPSAWLKLCVHSRDCTQSNDAHLFIKPGPYTPAHHEWLYSTRGFPV